MKHLLSQLTVKISKSHPINCKNTKTKRAVNWKNTKRKRAVSLLELLLVISLLSIVMGVFAIRFPQFLEKERFEKGVEIILQEIGFATDLMVISECDLSLELRSSERGILCSYILPDNLKKAVKKKWDPYLIKGVEGVRLNLEKGRVMLDFKGKDGLITQGILEFTKAELKKEVVLQGFPTSLKGKGKIHYEAAYYPEEILSSL